MIRWQNSWSTTGRLTHLSLIKYCANIGLINKLSSSVTEHAHIVLTPGTALSSLLNPSARPNVWLRYNAGCFFYPPLSLSQGETITGACTVYPQKVLGRVKGGSLSLPSRANQHFITAICNIWCNWSKIRLKLKKIRKSYSDLNIAFFHSLIKCGYWLNILECSR